MNMDRVRCPCGSWREIAVNRFGYTVETCRCGYHSSLRGNPPAEETPKKLRLSSQDPNLPICAWADGCTRRAAMWNTKMCREHAALSRRKYKRDHQREYQRKKARRKAAVAIGKLAMSVN